MNINQAIESNDFVNKILSQNLRKGCELLNFGFTISVNDFMYLYWAEIRYDGVDLYPAYWVDCDDVQDIQVLASAFDREIDDYQLSISDDDMFKDFVIFIYYNLQTKYNTMAEPGLEKLNATYDDIVDNVYQYIDILKKSRGNAMTRKEIYSDCMENFIKFYQNPNFVI